MRHVTWILIALTAACLTAYGQQQLSEQPATLRDSTQQTNPNQQPDANSQQSNADTPGAAEATTEPNNAGQQQDDGQASSAAAVSESSSSSGSPAVLSKGNGRERDGTNNVQRASMNMVGSPATGLGLDKISTEDANSELEDRQGYTQDKEMSERKQAGGTPPAGQSGEINNKSRRENNEQSDQNLSAKEKANSANQGDEDKSDAKTRKRRTRG